MFRSLRFAISVCAAVLPLTSQQEPVFRVSVDLVQVDAVVTDSQGRRVTNLGSKDFQVFEDGKPQQITRFSYVQVPGEPAAARTRLPAGMPRGASFGSPAIVSRENLRRTVVMIADDLGLSADDIPNVRNAMKRFVAEQMRPDDLVSIMRASGGSGLMQQVTNDKQQLLAAIDRIQYSIGRVGQTWYVPIHKVDAASEVENESNERLARVRSPFLGSGTLATLAYAIDGLRELPGRKAIVLFSDGIPQRGLDVVRLANRASVVIYTIDARGLASFFLTAVDFCKPPLCVPRGEERAREMGYRESQTSLDVLARGTGGLFFHDNNDLGDGVAAALGDMSDYYLLGYQPPRDDFQTVNGRHPFHRIEVRVLKPGLHVRSRSGFAGVPDPPANAPAVSESADEELRTALFSPFHANGFGVQLAAFYSGPKVTGARRSTSQLTAMLAIDAQGLQFRDAADGGKMLNIDIAAVAYAENNQAVAKSFKTFAASLNGEELNRILASGLVYGMDIEVPNPGAYQIRVAARDAHSGRIGSASLFIEVPDFNRGLAFSSVVLSDSDPVRAADLRRAGVLGAGSSITRVFEQGASLSYDCTIYGAAITRETGKPRVDLQIDLFRGPERVYTGKPIPLPVADGSSKAALRASGEIKLPPTLPPGNYTLLLLAYDRLRRQSSPVTQWTDFTLMAPPTAP